MRQASLFDLCHQTGDAVALAGLMPSIRAAMNRVAGKDEEGRKQLVEKINTIAKRESVALTRGGGKTIEKSTLDKWLQASDQGHAPTLEAIAIFCLAAGDASPLKYLISLLGLEVIARSDLRYLRYGKACAGIKKAKDELKNAEAEL